MKRLFLAAGATLSAAACTLPTNVKLKKIDELRAAQTACLVNNVAEFEDRVSEAAKIGRFVAMSCNVETEKLVFYAVPNSTPRERQAFENDAVLRATGYVMRARGGASG